MIHDKMYGKAEARRETNTIAAVVGALNCVERVWCVCPRVRNTCLDAPERAGQINHRVAREWHTSVCTGAQLPIHANSNCRAASADKGAASPILRHSSFRIGERFIAGLHSNHNEQKKDRTKKIAQTLGNTKSNFLLGRINEIPPPSNNLHRISETAALKQFLVKQGSKKCCSPLRQNEVLEGDRLYIVAPDPPIAAPSHPVLRGQGLEHGDIERQFLRLVPPLPAIFCSRWGDFSKNAV